MSSCNDGLRFADRCSVRENLSGDTYINDFFCGVERPNKSVSRDWCVLGGVSSNGTVHKQYTAKVLVLFGDLYTFGRAGRVIFLCLQHANICKHCEDMQPSR